MKAMDFHAALLSADSVAKLQEITTRIQYERSLLEYCGVRGLSRIVRLLESGNIFFDDSNPDPIKRAASRVDFFIFEFAEHGDLRRHITFNPTLPGSWKLRVLHGIAAAIAQLHGVGVAHQDIKPSNVLSFETDKFKIGDLGRSSREGYTAPTDQNLFPGDRRYSPPEFEYGHTVTDRVDRRLGSDIFMLGSMISFLYAGTSASYLLVTETPAAYLPGTWRGRYEDVLPFLVDAQARCAQKIASSFPSTCADKMVVAFMQLTHPNPLLRGHPDTRSMPDKGLGIDRYISLFNNLADRAEIAERASR
ncbi:MAG TPA: protein kinase [Burkholderiales bacterium]|nr:protein kinase [Burkholderiales bacterium]